MLIEPQLKKFMDLLIARRRPRNEAAEDELRSDLLRYLVDEGFAEMQIRDGQSIWVITQHFYEVMRNEEIESAINEHGNAAEKAQQAKLTGSLKIMLTAFADRARKERLARGPRKSDGGCGATHACKIGQSTADD